MHIFFFYLNKKKKKISQLCHIVPYKSLTCKIWPSRKIGQGQGLSFERSMTGLSPKSYMPSFLKIGSQISENIFERFVPYKMYMAAIPVMYIDNNNRSCI